MFTRKPFERVTPESVGIASAAVGRLLDRLEPSESIEVHGLMLMRHGKIFAECFWKPYSAELPHALYSLTKSFTATALGLAVTDGLVRTGDKLIAYFPEYAHVCGDPRINDITVRDVLSMSSGKPEQRCACAEWREHFFAIPFTHDPGHFEYSCEDTHIVMALAEKLYDRRLDLLLAERVFDKVGVDAYRLKWLYLPDGSPVGCGGLFCTAEDALRLLKLYLDGGVCEGQRILAGAYVREATSAIVPVNPSSGNDGYGYQIRVPESAGVFCGSGALGQYAFACPEKDMAGVMFESTARHGANHFADITDFIRESTSANRLPEDRQAYEHLRSRCAGLTLPQLAKAPVSPVMDAISGCRYWIESGHFTLRNALYDHMTLGDPFPSIRGMDWFSFENADNGFIMRFVEDRREVALKGGWGESMLNSYAQDRTPIDKMVLSGEWMAGRELLISVRWIEECYSMTASITFSGRTAVVRLKRALGDYEVHPLRFATVIAVARA